MASLASIPPPLKAAWPPPSPTERRLRAEWALLGELAARNPERLRALTADDTTFSLSLRGTPAILHRTGETASVHALRIVYPPFFPAVPLELYLQEPVFHPNIHPETGFVCLWNRHRVSHTVEHALHKAAAMLGWRLGNREPEHTMQPAAAALPPAEQAALMRELDAAPLRGVEFPAGTLPPRAFRRRLG